MVFHLESAAESSGRGLFWAPRFETVVGLSTSQRISFPPTISFMIVWPVFYC